MKPHIRKDRGVWTCRLAQKCFGHYNSRRYYFAWGGGPIGHGNSVREAYADWQEQTRAARSAATT